MVFRYYDLNDKEHPSGVFLIDMDTNVLVKNDSETKKQVEMYRKIQSLQTGVDENEKLEEGDKEKDEFFDENWLLQWDQWKDKPFVDLILLKKKEIEQKTHIIDTLKELLPQYQKAIVSFIQKKELCETYEKFLIKEEEDEEEDELKLLSNEGVVEIKEKDIEVPKKKSKEFCFCVTPQFSYSKKKKINFLKNLLFFQIMINKEKNGPLKFVNKLYNNNLKLVN